VSPFKKRDILVFIQIDRLNIHTFYYYYKHILFVLTFFGINRLARLSMAVSKSGSRWMPRCAESSQVRGRTKTLKKGGKHKKGGKYKKGGKGWEEWKRHFKNAVCLSSYIFANA
jgi:hypothetical protein